MAVGIQTRSFPKRKTETFSRMLFNTYELFLHKIYSRQGILFNCGCSWAIISICSDKKKVWWVWPLAEILCVWFCWCYCIERRARILMASLPEKLITSRNCTKKRDDWVSATAKWGITFRPHPVWRKPSWELLNLLSHPAVPLVTFYLCPNSPFCRMFSTNLWHFSFRIKRRETQVHGAKCQSRNFVFRETGPRWTWSGGAVCIFNVRTLREPEPDRWGRGVDSSLEIQPTQKQRSCWKCPRNETEFCLLQLVLCWCRVIVLSTIRLIRRNPWPLAFWQAVKDFGTEKFCSEDFNSYLNWNENFSWIEPSDGGSGAGVVRLDG